MELVTLINHSAQLYGIIIKSHQASDFLASNYFRQKKYIGSHDRRFISEITFASLRLKSLLEYCFNKSETLQHFKETTDVNYFHVTIACILSEIPIMKVNYAKPAELYNEFHKNNQNNFIELLIDAISKKNNISLDIAVNWIDSVKLVIKELDNKALEITNNLEYDLSELETIAVRYSMPYWILDKLTSNPYFKLSLSEAVSLAESMLYPAPLTIRINESLINRDKVIEQFNKAEIPVVPCKISNSGLIIERRVQLSEYDLYKNGFIEVQDEGSQLISLAVAPEKDAKILDACAGAGGKSLHLASLQADSGEIISNDIYPAKLRELNKRAKRCGFNSIKTIIINEKNKKQNLSQYKEYFDYVLIDAPCTGTGTVRRMPMQKWRLSEELLAKYVKRQQEIIKFYSQFVCVGGILVYATCSFIPDENDFVIDEFLKNNNNFETDSLYNAFIKNDIHIQDLKTEDYKYHVLTSKYGCDSFFIARLKRIE